MMKTRSSDTWQGKKPGNWDNLNLSTIFPSRNSFGIPEMASCTSIPDAFVPYGYWKAVDNAPHNAAIHFWLDDYRFEPAWNRPTRHLWRFLSVGTVVTPDFSVFTDWPPAVNIYQTYRNRYLGCLWQRYGITVIPSVSWSTPESLEYSFLGVPKGSVVAIQMQAARVEDAENIQIGLRVLMAEVEPSLICCYGKIKDGLRLPDMPMREYPTFWDQRKRDING